MQKIKKCTICQTEFSCGLSPEGKSCWCTDFPNIIPLTEGAGCLCENCLRSEINERIHAFTHDLKQGKTTNTAVNYKSLTGKLMEGIDYYVEKGNFVFTEWYHLKRGSCCGNGCRHCPYQKGIG
jgi:hypothetical protein